ncbi:sensor histidine kinase [Corynebacterium pseudokroppenstedtii]|uniref:sensor histidine kinase n=1 Tax=Corynebacterium pseudokroppenstedtii TaxID=2804917 RepID=UPI0030799399
MARPHPRTWRNTELLYPAVWLIYLTFPLGTCFTADAGIFARIIASILVIAFGVVYLSVYRYVHKFEDNKALKLWGVTGVLIAIGALTYPVTDLSSVCFIPYICALWVFIRSGRQGIITGIFVSTVLVVCVLFASPQLHGQTLPIVLAVGVGVAIVIGVGVAHADEERRRELERQLDRAHQREAYATAMHDVLSHSLTVIAVKAQLASRLLDAEADKARKDEARGEIDDIYELSHSALNDMRSALDELAPPSLTETIEEAQAVCTSAGISLTAQVDDDLPPATASLYAAIVKEATTNILRHAQAQSASITATPAKLIIADDGRGFDQEERSNANGLPNAEDGGRHHGLANVKQHGLEGMKRRAHNIGASFSIHSAPGEGTTLTVETTTRKTARRKSRSKDTKTQEKES